MPTENNSKRRLRSKGRARETHADTAIFEGSLGCRPAPGESGKITGADFVDIKPISLNAEMSRTLISQPQR